MNTAQTQYPRDNILKFDLNKKQASDTLYVNDVLSGGDGGGGMSEDLGKRVTRLEDCVADIKTHMATLTTRSENFATKADVIGIRVEMAGLGGNLKQEITVVRCELKSDLADFRTDFQREMRTQTTWLCGAVITAMGVFAGVIALLK